MIGSGILVKLFSLLTQVMCNPVFIELRMTSRFIQVARKDLTLVAWSGFDTLQGHVWDYAVDGVGTDGF